MRNASPRPAPPERYTPHFRRRAGWLWCEGVPVARIAEQVGTPVYVYSRASLEAAYRRLDAAFAALPHSLCYAVKANSNLTILRLLARLGSHFDIVSGGELYRLRCIGVPGARMVFSGVGKSREEIREALRERVELLNIESEAELEVVAAEAARLRRRAPAALRVNPDVVAGGHPHISTGHHLHKFGVEWEAARRLYLAHRDSRWIDWQGVSAHIGSQILRVAPFRRAVGRLAGWARQLLAAGIRLRYFDFGGGVGIRYTREHPPDLAAYARAIAAAVRPLGCRLLLEPGRMLVGPAGILLMRVAYVKATRGKNFIVVDAAMNDFLRPALYGAVHPVTPVGPARKPARRADVVGPVCETSDCFLRDERMARVEPGDLLALWGSGAYGFVSATNYNSRLRPAEVLVDAGRFRLIRRRETRADLIRGE